MANRQARDVAVLAKIETTYGTDAVPTGGANAILVSNVTANPLNAQNVDRGLIRAYLGGSEQLVGTAFKEASYDVEIQSSGTLGTAPPWGPLLRACGFAETITASTRVEYTPITNGVESLTQYIFDSGVLHKLLGSRGNAQFNLGVSERPIFSFNFLGIDGGDTAAANPSTTLTAFRTPQVITDANTTDLTFGCTYSAGALSGGTAYPSRGIQLNLGNSVNFTPLLGGETIDLTQREVVGSLELDLTAAQEVSFMASVKANSTQSLGFVHGTTSTLKVGFFFPAVQLINPKKSEINGKRLIAYDIRIVPSSGNDEMRIFCI